MNRPQFIISSTTVMLNISQINRIRNVNNRILDLIFVPYGNVQEDIKGNDDILYNDYKGASFDAISTRLSEIDWNVISNEEIEGSIDGFYTVIYEIINGYVPKRRKIHGSFPVWFSTGLKKLYRIRKQLIKYLKKQRLDHTPRGHLCEKKDGALNSSGGNILNSSILWEQQLCQSFGTNYGPEKGTQIDQFSWVCISVCSSIEICRSSSIRAGHFYLTESALICNITSDEFDIFHEPN
ncbi:hypothetical protein WA026_012450 [Henosepilachna vigintioctopunctata]|uniref:Uncharacterized protein n=1 Tax=Henosepilachna vigintioctopunctata TaxID=420089 RepID=A0AAW1UQ75_9CUCU